MRILFNAGPDGPLSRSDEDNSRIDGLVMDEVAGMRFAPIASDSRSLRFQQGLKDHHASLRLLIAAASVFGALRLDSFSHFSKLRRYSIPDPPCNKENRYLIKQT